MPQNDTLFLLPAGFEDNDRKEYCPECAEIWGVLNYFPQLKDVSEIVYCEIEKPRAPLVSRLGEAHQNCPTLILGANSPHLDDSNLQKSGEFFFYDNARDIGKYWARTQGIAFPRGS